MAKVAFSKLNCKTNTDVGTFEWGDQIIEVKAYLPIAEKFTLMLNVLNDVVDDAAFYNPSKVDLFLTLETVFAYTNISFTEKQKENCAKLYDMIVSSGLWDDILTVLPKSEFNELTQTIYQTVHQIYSYRNSARAIIENLSENSDTLSQTAEEVMNKVQSAPEEMKLLKDVIDKLG